MWARYIAAHKRRLLPDTFGMFYAHASGDLVYDETINVASTARVSRGNDFVKIGSQAAGDLETNEIAFLPEQLGELDLERPAAVHATPPART